MTTIQNGEDDSFIILGTSPGTSLDMKYSGIENGDIALDKEQMEEAMKDLPAEANMAFKAHFKLGGSDRAYGDLRVQYNNGFRAVMGLPWRCSASGMFANHNVDSFECIMRKRCTSALERLRGSPNTLLKLFAARWDSPLLRRWIQIHAIKPSPSSMMVASTIITEDKSTEELQKRFGELLDENVILKETLKQNNESLKEQFLLIASCQEDMMKTHMLHKEKFDETKDLVKKLRQENSKLKHDISRLSDGDTQPNSQISSHSQMSSENGEKESGKSGPSSALEFVTSPDDDTINKLTSQLELVEKQRRQVIVENEKLTWQKESLEHIVDATSKERDDLKEKLKNIELQLSTKDTEHATEISNLKFTIQDLQTQIETLSVPNILPEEITNRDALIRQLETRVATLMADLKAAQLRIFELESVKLEMTKLKSGESEQVKTYKEQIQDLHSRLKEASTTVFQPVRFSISEEPESSSEFASLTANVRLYDRTLKHLAEVLNSMTHGATDSLVQTLGLVASLHDYKLDRSSVEQFKSGLAEVKQQMEKQHSMTLNNIGQVRSTLSIFEGIFRDYNELLKKTVSKPKLERSSDNVGALTAALVARGQELQALQAELARVRDEKEDTELMKAQLDLYKSDFEAERQSREKMASERENARTDLRTAERRIQELNKQLDEVRKLNPSVFQMAASRAAAPAASPARAAPRPAASPRAPARGSPAATGNMVFTCPKCMRFSCDQYKVMEDHFDFCLDDF